MKDFPLVVSFYTEQTLYQLEVQNLIASCEKWDLEFHVEPIASFGSWEKNCAYKPLFLLQKLQQFARPLFWVDADAIILRKPPFPESFNADFSVRINPWEKTHPSQVMSGSIYVNATEGGERVLKAWAKECIERLSDPERTEEFWDQIALRDVLNKGVPGATVEGLPWQYTGILDNPHDARELEKMIIGHTQASRRFKKIINNSNSS